MKRNLFAALSAMLVLLSACGGNEGAVTETQTAGVADTEAVTEAVPGVQYPREAIDYNGATFTVLNCIDELWDGSFHILDYEQETGDSIEDGIFNRARNTEERFNITLNVIKDELFDLGQILNKAVMAGDSTYDAAYNSLSGGTPEPLLGKSGLNLYDIESLHLEDDWWHQVFIEDATLFRDTLYAMPDFCNLMGYTRTQSLAFNKNMFDTYDMELPYDLVREGKWTVDKMREYMAQVVNLNGDASFKKSEETVNAVYGFGAQHEGSMFSLMAGNGESFIVFDGDGSPVFREDLSVLESAYTKLADLFSTDGYGVMKNGNANSNDGSAMDLFSAGRLLFYCNATGACAAQTFRDFEFEYGILPMPKFSEDQECYYSAISEYTLSLIVPITASDPEMTGNIINYMSFAGKTDIIPELQVALCYKGLRDEDSIEMLNIIMDTIYIDLGYVQSWSTDLSKQLAKQIMSNNLRLASIAEKNQKKITKTIERAIEDMTEGRE